MKLRNRVLILGGALGALVGVAAAHLYLRTALGEEGEDEEDVKLPRVQPGDALKVVLGVLAAVRGIVGLGQP
ncbi:MAG: hypothetical protein PVI59_04315 [Anaerolineae bacterium]|jgi:hypothetical protein